MKITSNLVVAIDYTLKDDDGNVVDTSEGKDPLYYLHDHSNIVVGLEEALEGRGIGDEVDVNVPPEKGYGAYRQDLVFDVPLTQLPAGMRPQKGMRLNMQTGAGGSMACTIKTVKLKAVTVDANHALADKNLNFHVVVRKIRKATKDEMSHGHAHSPGHDHH